MMKKVAVFTGTRAEYGLLYWLLHDIQADKELQLQLIVSGSHLSHEFGNTYQQIEADGFTIAEKIEILLSSDTANGIVKSMGLALIGLADAFSRLQPDILVLLGDRYEALAAAQAAMLMRIPIIHLHGGEISEGAADDAMRHAISKLSYLHATSTECYRQRVIQLGEAPDRVVNVGAIGLEHLHRTVLLSVAELADALKFPLKQPYFVVTYHPVTLANEPAEQSFTALLDALDHYQDYQIILTYPNADAGGRKIIPILKDYATRQSHRVLAVTSLGQLRYLSAIKHAAAVIGNSSSGLVEAPAFNVPTVNIGFRQQGRLSATSVFHCRAKTIDIKNTLDTIINQRDDKKTKKNLQSNTSAKIIKMIKNLQFDAVKVFYDIPKQ